MISYDNVSKQHQELIIKFGEIIYNKLDISNCSDIDEYFKNENNINEKLKQSFNEGLMINKMEIEKYQTQIKLIEEEYQEKINNLNITINNKDKEIISNINLHQSYYQNGFDEGKLYNNGLLEEKEKQLKDKTELLELYRPKIYENMKQKGDMVEDLINDELVRKINRMAFVIDTSDIWGSGDRIVSFPKYKMMIECKNKTSIKKSDIEQFKEHFTRDFNDSKYNIAVFLSYNCEYILGKGCFKLEKHNNNLVIYIGLNKDVSDNNKNQIIEYYLTMINDTYLSDIKNDQKDNLETSLIDNILEIFNDILTIEKYELPYIESINQKYINKKRKINDLILKLENNNIPIPLEIHSIDGNDDIFINKIIYRLKSTNKNYFIPKQNWKKYIIDMLELDEFYIKFLNKKGITRDKFINLN